VPPNGRILVAGTACRQPDGRIVVTGTAGLSATFSFVAARFTA